MKRFLTFLIFVLLITVRSFAQENAEIQALEQKVTKYKNMKGGGAALAVLGGLLMIGGVVTIHDNPPNILYGESNNFAGGMALFVVGAAGLGSGIPLWTIGAKRERMYRTMLETTRTRLTVDAHPRGIGLTLHF